MKQNRSMLGYPRSQTVNAFMGPPGRLTLQQWSRVLQNIPQPPGFKTLSVGDDRILKLSFINDQLHYLIRHHQLEY